MTDQELEERVRAWYAAEVGATETAPDNLRESLAAIPRRTAPDRPLGSRRGITLLAAAALLLMGGALAAGSGFLKLPSVVTLPPSPIPSSGLVPTPSPTVATPRPSEPATPRPTGILGGRLLLVRDIPRDANGKPIDTVHGFATGTYEVSLVDPETAATTVLGSVPYDPRTGYQPEVRWAPDGRHAMITDRRGKLWSPDVPTTAASQIAFACCQRSGVVGWVFSPQGDRIAGLQQREIQVPGQGLTARASTIVVSNVDGTGLVSLPLPKGADTGAAGVTLSWMPDESAVVLAGCQPCNYGDPGAPSDVTHSHLFIVPIDGSPVRVLLDETKAGVWDPNVSPDGSSIVVGRRECRSGEVQPYCWDGNLTISSVRVTDGRLSVLAATPDLGVGPRTSPDGRRIAYSVEKIPPAGSDVIDTKGGIYVVEAAGGEPIRLSDGFDPRWSPDGSWLLYSDATGGSWIVSADGGEARSIGSYAAAAW